MKCDGEILMRCEKCNKGFLIDRGCEIFLKSRGIIFPRCPNDVPIPRVICKHCKTANFIPLKLFGQEE